MLNDERINEILIKIQKIKDSKEPVRRPPHKWEQDCGRSLS
jgi:hypothetical protein